MNVNLEKIIARQSLRTQARIRAALLKWSIDHLTSQDLEDLEDDSTAWGKAKKRAGGGFAKEHCRGRALKAAAVDVVNVDVENDSLKAILATAGAPRCTCCGVAVNTRKSDKKLAEDYELGHAFVPLNAQHAGSALLEYAGWTAYDAKHVVGTKGKKASASYNVQVQCASCNASQKDASVLSYLDKKGGRGRPSPLSKKGVVIDRDTFIVESVLRWILMARIDNAIAQDAYAKR